MNCSFSEDLAVAIHGLRWWQDPIREVEAQAGVHIPPAVAKMLIDYALAALGSL